ncbi:exosome complex exonuclease Rrp41 [Candidatus Pacearchaeota archaeon]|nr:exosome complex exonuclease Rrp41 [Candidatus Pacearchaeota archaeon]|tara:strand:+ start:965 stop:1684 length:720 start_codon:yes stop_codon:yes gene_type:complete
MTYTKRPDGREMHELRPIRAEVGIIPNADGSALFASGKTVAIAAVYGPKILHPASMRNPEKGIIRCEYNMLPFSVSERARPGPSRRSKEISKVTSNALSSVVDLSRFPNSVVDVQIMILQADAGTRCAGINAASMALAHAGIVMNELVTSVSIGKIDDKIVADITKEEEDWEEGEGPTDIPFTMTSRKNDIVHLQLDGNIPTSRFKESIDASVKACNKILDYQIRALKGEKINENEGKK